MALFGCGWTALPLLVLAASFMPYAFPFEYS
jgi:hypothetical protein